MNLSLPNDREFAWKDGTLWCENVPLKDLAARFGTPLYVYSKQAIVNAFQSYQKPLEPYKHLMCFAVKANSNLSIIRLLGKLGAGFDIVSEGELRRIQAAGCDTSKVIFSGVAKTYHEIEAALDADIKCFNIESPAELDRVIAVAQKKGKKARVSFRVNPDVDAKTHPYISTGLKKNKFGIAYDQAVELYLKASRSPELEVVGIDCHIGSQITDTAPFVDACEKLCTLLDKLRLNRIDLQHIDFGGGLGIQYSNEAVPSPMVLVAALRRVLVKRGYGDKEMIFEAGRSLVGNSGALLMTVQYMKQGELKNFCIVDCGMNDMIRPTLYQAWMQIVPVTPKKEEKETYCYVVGPVCETGDWLGKDRLLNVQEGDLLALLSAGAYGMSMASNYNSRCLPAEVLVDGNRAVLIRKRQCAEELFSDEILVTDTQLGSDGLTDQ